MQKRNPVISVMDTTWKQIRIVYAVEVCDRDIAQVDSYPVSRPDNTVAVHIVHLHSRDRVSSYQRWRLKRPTSFLCTTKILNWIKVNLVNLKENIIRITQVKFHFNKVRGIRRVVF